jgi:signal transduction histidine kinase
VHIPSETWPGVVALAAHELRTPAGVASGYCRMLFRGQAGDITAAQRTMLEAVDRSTSRVAEVLAQMSELAHLEDGSTVPARQSLTLAALTRPLAGESGAPRVELTTPVPAGRLEGDLVRLQRALAAVVALHAVEGDPLPAGALHVRGGRASLAIGARSDIRAWADAPPGDPLTPWDDLRSGHGLDLVIARVVVALHGGEIASWPVPRHSRAVTVIHLPVAGD